MRTILGLSTVMLVGAVGCASQPTGSTKTTTTTTNDNPAVVVVQPGTSSDTAKTSDAEIMRIVATANQAEVDAAKLAMKNAKSNDVKNFAKHMQAEHSKNTQQAMSIAKKNKVTPAVDVAAADQMQKDAQAKMDDLKKQKGADFDRAYMDSMVEMHQQVLNDLNNTLIPAAQNPQLKSFLETTKTHVQDHLAKAEKIQSSLK